MFLLLEINKEGAGHTSGAGGPGGDASGTGVGSSSAAAAASSLPSTEVVFPRIIVESVKRRLQMIRDKCRNVTINFIPSDSKSKQFAKMFIEGQTTNDIEVAQEHIWQQLNQFCQEHQQLIQQQQQHHQQHSSSSSYHHHHHHGSHNNPNGVDPLPKTPAGIFKDLGFLGGELTVSEFHRLLEYDKTTGTAPVTNMTSSSTSSSTADFSNGIGNHSNNNSKGIMNNNSSSSSSNKNSNTTTNIKSQDAKEDLAKWSPFFASFEASQRCAIWVQSDFDKGRIDSSNRLINEATPNGPRKIYLGCPPKQIPKLWSLLKTRATEVARGVKYLYLGPDRLYQPSMMRKGGQFFDFVKSITGASVTVDSMTGDHLRIDGRGSSTTSATNPINLVDGVETSAGNSGLNSIVDITNGNNVKSKNDVVASQMYGRELPSNMSEGERAALAEELVKLQIELYRDHCIRQHDWIFGRDWTLARRIFAQSNNPLLSSGGNGSGTSTNGSSTNGGTAESRTVAQAAKPLIDELNLLLGSCPVIDNFKSVDDYLSSVTVEDLSQFSVIMASQISLPQAVRLSQMCAKAKTIFYLADCFGFYGATLVELPGSPTLQYRPEQGKDVLDPVPLKEYVSFEDMVKVPLHQSVNRFHKTPPKILVWYRALLHYQQTKGDWPGEQGNDDVFDPSIVKAFLKEFQKIYFSV